MIACLAGWLCRSAPRLLASCPACAFVWAAATALRCVLAACVWHVASLLRCFLGDSLPRLCCWWPLCLSDLLALQALCPWHALGSRFTPILPLRPVCWLFSSFAAQVSMSVLKQFPDVSCDDGG